PRRGRDLERHPRWARDADALHSHLGLERGPGGVRGIGGRLRVAGNLEQDARAARVAAGTGGPRGTLRARRTGVPLTARDEGKSGKAQSCRQLRTRVHTTPSESRLPEVAIIELIFSKHPAAPGIRRAGRRLTPRARRGP